MSNCENCSSVILKGHEVVLRGRNKRVPCISVCPTCVTEMERLFKEETEDPNLMGGSLCGVIAALVASFLWYGIVVTTNYRLGIVAVAIDWIVAQASQLWPWGLASIWLFATLLFRLCLRREAKIFRFCCPLML